MNKQNVKGNWYRYFVRRASNEHTKDSAARQQAQRHEAAQRLGILDAATELGRNERGNGQGEER